MCLEIGRSGPDANSHRDTGKLTLIYKLVSVRINCRGEYLDRCLINRNIYI